MEETIKQELRASAEVKKALADFHTKEIIRAVEMIVSAFRSGGKVLLAGNGGSAADAQHIAAEFVGHFKRDRKPLPAIALTTDTSALTAIGNDYSFDVVFSRQVEALAQGEHDVFIAITTSGRSANITRAVEMARKKNIATIGLLGKGGGDIRDVVDCAIVVPSDDTQHIQEAHITIGHIICGLVEQKLFGNGEA